MRTAELLCSSDTSIIVEYGVTGRYDLAGADSVGSVRQSNKLNSSNFP